MGDKFAAPGLLKRLTDAKGFVTLIDRGTIVCHEERVTGIAEEHGLGFGFELKIRHQSSFQPALTARRAGPSTSMAYLPGIACRAVSLASGASPAAASRSASSSK